jgi:hypothetical protein
VTFGNKSILVHLLRGILGLGSLLIALKGYDLVGWRALLLLPVALWMLKGCPLCWSIGLVESVAFKFLQSTEQIEERKF